MNTIIGKNISYCYDFGTDHKPALNEINIEIRKGEFIAILGQNGCGKSTLVKHFNALLSLQKGNLTVAEIDVRNEKDLWDLRRLCGMVFQNPDNQFVSSVVEEDISFGLENYDIPDEEIPERIQTALSLVHMTGFEKRAPHTLSGGEKQRIALAGVLALDPDILIFDEATSMLDPKGRKEILSCIKQLHTLDKTIIMITHSVEETIYADRIFLMQKGKILAGGTPREILSNRDLLSQTGLTAPVPVQLYHSLADSGISLSHCPLTNEELIAELELLKGGEAL